MSSTKVRISQQVWEYLQVLAPGPRRKVRLGIRQLQQGLGDIVPLQGDLEGFYRLRIQSHRLIFRYVLENKKQMISCEFIAPRDIVYQFFSRIAAFVLSPEIPRSLQITDDDSTNPRKRS